MYDPKPVVGATEVMTGSVTPVPATARNSGLLAPVAGSRFTCSDALRVPDAVAVICTLMVQVPPTASTGRGVARQVPPVTAKSSGFTPVIDAEVIVVGAPPVLVTTTGAVAPRPPTGPWPTWVTGLQFAPHSPGKLRAPSGCGAKPAAPGPGTSLNSYVVVSISVPGLRPSHSAAAVPLPTAVATSAGGRFGNVASHVPSAL